MQILQDNRVPFADTLQQEKWAMQYQMLLAFRDPNWRNTLNSYNGDSSESSTRLRTAFISKQEIIDRIGRNLDAQSDNARLPYFRQKHDAPTNPDYLDELLGVGISFRAGEVATQCDTQNALLQTALALQAYKVEHGAYPPTLNALVPRYLKTVPLDSFSKGQMLHYKLKPLRYISDIRQVPVPQTQPNAPRQTKPQIEHSNWPYTLYSIGSDGQDDGGQPIENTSKAGSLYGRYRVDFDKTGDIVAGVNTS